MIYEARLHISKAIDAYVEASKSPLLPKNKAIKINLENARNFLSLTLETNKQLEHLVREHDPEERDLLLRRSAALRVLSERMNNLYEEDHLAAELSSGRLRNLSARRSDELLPSFRLKLSPEAENFVVRLDARQHLAKRRPAQQPISLFESRPLHPQDVKHNDEDSEWQESSGRLSKQHKSKSTRSKRGHYKKYSQELKQRAVELAERQGIPFAAKSYCIPSKNLKRWMDSGLVRKKGGRKTQDPQMEKRLNGWIADYQATYKAMPTSGQIKKKALEFTTLEGFKASKGWLEKFQLRHGYAEKKKKAGRDLPHNILEDIKSEDRYYGKFEDDGLQEFPSVRRAEVPEFALASDFAGPLPLSY